MKRQLIVPFTCLLLCLSGGGGVYAFLSDKGEAASNKFTVGNIETKIVENFPSGQMIDPECTDGQVISKTVKVQNVGKAPCYVRVTVGFSDDTVGAELTGINKTDWVKPVDDDYYYYRRILHPGETTSAVFTSVTIPPLADKRLDGMEEDALKIDVYEEAVQVQHAGAYFMDYEAAWDFYTSFR